MVILRTFNINLKVCANDMHNVEVNMKKLIKEFKEIIDEYGMMAVGIAMIIFVGYATSYFTICGLWWCFTTLTGGEYEWCIPSITWGIGMICFYILKRKTKKEIEEANRYNQEEVE